MKRKDLHTGACLAMFILASLLVASPSSGEEGLKFAIKPGVGIEYFSRTLHWDEDSQTSKLTSFLTVLNAEREIQEGFSLTGLLGYSSSNFNGLVFRQLPFSIDFQAGGIGGILFGIEGAKRIVSFDTFEIGGLAQFVIYLGMEKEWPVPGLSVEGKVSGKASWMRAVFGPTLTYKGFDNFSPFVSVSFNKLWGKFKMNQVIQTLDGEEEKKVYGESLFGLSAGAMYDVSDRFSLKGEASLLPHKNGVDAGISIKALYSF